MGENDNRAKELSEKMRKGRGSEEFRMIELRCQNLKMVETFFFTNLKYLFSRNENCENSD